MNTSRTIVFFGFTCVFALGVLGFTSRSFATPSPSDCNAGEYFNGTSCALCAPGTANLSVLSGGIATGCLICEVGTFAENFGQETCNECPAGTYNPFTQAQECIQCPAGTTSGPGSTECRTVENGKRSSISKDKFIIPSQSTTNSKNSSEAETSTTTGYTPTSQDIEKIERVLSFIGIILNKNPEQQEMITTLITKFLEAAKQAGNDRKVTIFAMILEGL